MRVFNRLGADAARQRVLAQGSTESAVLQRATCLRCGNVWWPRRPSKPMRCANCKSPYWDRPRQGKTTMHRPLLNSMTPEESKTCLKDRLAQSVGREDRSLAKALEVLKAMKAAGRTWNEMAERVQREFGTHLDRDQLKALVR